MNAVYLLAIIGVYIGLPLVSAVAVLLIASGVLDMLRAGNRK